MRIGRIQNIRKLKEESSKEEVSFIKIDRLVCANNEKEDTAWNGILCGCAFYYI